MKASINKFIPVQTKGMATDAKDRLILSNRKEAGEVFLTALTRMLDVNRWP
jgi:hypothetical protein